jgi:hypothetical protein
MRHGDDAGQNQSGKQPKTTPQAAPNRASILVLGSSHVSFACLNRVFYAFL